MSMDICWPPKPMKTLRHQAPRSKKDLLRAARRAGIRSQAELARRLGRNPSYLARVLSKRVQSGVVWEQVWTIVASVGADMSMDMDVSKAHAAGGQQ